MNEAETRAEHIDPALKAAGWGVVEGSRVMREYRITEGRLQGAGQRAKPEIADYVLMYRNHKLAVIEAKRRDLPHTEGLAQAKQYAGKIGARLTYATNGLRIYGVDMQSGIEGDVAAYPSPQELWNLIFAEANDWRERFAAVPFEDKGGMWGSRYYQDSAINAALEAIADNQQRILLTLATGTGKTFIAFQIAWKLFHARWNQTYRLFPPVRPEVSKGESILADSVQASIPQPERVAGGVNRRPRILFLADRNILADQAYNAFSAFEDSNPGSLVRIAPDDIRKKGRVPKNGSVFFTIFQTFMSGPSINTVRPELVEGQVENGLRQAQPERAFYFGEYPPDFFDFIVIDECHRGGANDESTWRGILEYFAPAVQLGLTATPKRKDNVNTYAYFGEPVYVYSLKEGINDGFLTPFRVKQYATTLDEYVFTSDDKLVEGEIEAGKLYEEKDFNRSIEIVEREKYRVRLFMEAIDQREKTLVFCANQAHALLVRDLINQMKNTSTDPLYCVRVTANDGELGEQYLRAFQDNEKSIPTILTTSQKLSTGVDARNVRNIVLMRPINSMIEFKQIIGRGTRLYDGKDYFTIYDFVKAHKLFNDPEWDGEPIEVGEGGDKVFPAIAPNPQPEAKEPRPEYETKKKVRVKLRDGKERTIQHISVTTFWGPDGKPISATEFLTLLFGQLPEFFKDEDELRAIWSLPDTRKKLLEGLAEKGFGKEQLGEMQKIIDAENSDLFDVLAHVAFAMQPISREARAGVAHKEVHERFSDKQQAFLDFVLAHYVQEGVEELEQEKLTKLLRLRYHDSIPDAVADLGGDIDAIRNLFSGFQRYLYQGATASG
jgi:type I restriction enzyme R subunit